MNTTLNVGELMEKAKARAYAKNEPKEYTLENQNSIPALDHNITTKPGATTSQLTTTELYAGVQKCSKLLKRQTAFIRDGKQHATKSRQQLVEACQETLREMDAYSYQISPRNPHGHTDTDDPFAEDCLLVWGREIDMLRKGLDATPI